ncbi:hypothetical protein [Mucilaginibacter sp. SG564]|uniref:hypothetical protein n=1 Tax=Mucilaginibacter sp. SG564 TaxID=2587022 RepID=UPI001552873E|nr:hypothetical protein [Mucilaginibacter sp. SG564]NOW96006.1 hypothetical protein [Mucilaginibacter sp. SG564]
MLARLFENPVNIVEAGFESAQQDLEQFRKGYCSLFGHENHHRCGKRVNHFFEQDKTVKFFNDNKEKKISQLLSRRSNSELLSQDDIIVANRNQPFLETNKASGSINLLRKRSEIIKDQLFN